LGVRSNGSHASSISIFAPSDLVLSTFYDVVIKINENYLIASKIPLKMLPIVLEKDNQPLFFFLT